MDEDDQYKKEEIFVTPPLMSADSASYHRHGDGVMSDKQRGLLARLVELFKSARPGSDITKFQIPVQLNMPKSQLQVYGESLYCCGEDLLSKCAEGTSPMQRFHSVVAWHISTTRLAPFGQAPFNPILGETHHVSCGTLNVLLEQVSHHPPITALYATDSAKNLQMQWWHGACPRFYGNKVEVTVQGKRSLWLDSHKEEYELTSPKLLIRFFPVPGNEWVGSTTVKCHSSGLEATLVYKGKPFFGLRGVLGHLTGNIKDIKTNKILYDISGAWNKIVSVKDLKTGEVTPIYDAQSVLSKLRAPVVQNVKYLRLKHQDVAPSESVVVWRKVIESILRRDWEAGREAKHKVEEKQRALAKERKAAGKTWLPKHFEKQHVAGASSGDRGWQWCHQGQPVSEAPLSVAVPSL